MTIAKRNQHQHRQPNSEWRVALRGLKCFFYWKLEWTPRYTFAKTEGGSTWRGHGQSGSLQSCKEWVREQKEPLD
jgi:hypothetical protein